MKAILRKILILIIMLALGSLYGSCNNKPRITGCDSFRYQGHRYTGNLLVSICGSYGAGRSFYTKTGSPTFIITCEDGCLKAVEVYDGS